MVIFHLLFQSRPNLTIMTAGFAQTNQELKHDLDNTLVPALDYILAIQNELENGPEKHVQLAPIR